MKILPGIGLCFLCSGTAAQLVQRTAWAPDLQSTAYSLKQTDVFSFTANPAALRPVKFFTAGVYSERRYMLNELSHFSAHVVLPAKKGSSGFRVSHSGNAGYSETGAQLAFARSMGTGADVGIAVEYFHLGSGPYGKTSALSGTAGFIFHPYPGLQLGGRFSYPVLFQKAKYDPGLPVFFSMGGGYDVSDGLFLGINLVKEEGHPVSVAAALHYRFTERIYVRTGICTGPSQFYFGTGIRLHDLRLHTTASLHPQLGITPGLSLSYTANEK